MPPHKKDHTGDLFLYRYKSDSTQIQPRRSATFRFVSHQPLISSQRITLHPSQAGVEQSFIVESARTRCLLWGSCLPV